MNKNYLLTAFACAGIAFGAEYPNQVLWNQNVKDGYFTDVNNWVGATAVPTNKDQTASISVNNISGSGITVAGDYIIRFPAGVTTNYASLYIQQNNRDASLTLDTTEGTLYQAPSTYPSNWQGFGCYLYSTYHFFNFESVSVDGSYPIVSFSGGQLKTYNNGNGYFVDLLSGTLNWLDPLGVSASSCLVISRGDAHFTAHEGSSVKAGNVYLRRGQFYVEGGDHVLKNFYVGQAEKSGGSPLFVQKSGRIASTESFVIGGVATNPSYGIFTDDAVFNQQSGYFRVGSSDDSVAYFDVGQNAKMTVDKFEVGNGARSVSTVNITNDAEFVMNGLSKFGHENRDRQVAVNVGDNAKVTVTSDLYIKGNSTFSLKDNAVFSAPGKVTVTPGGTIDVSDNARYELLRETKVEGGSFALSGDASLIMRTNVVGDTSSTLSITKGGQVEFSGGRSIMSFVSITDGGTSEAPNVFRVTGGEHIAVRADGHNAYLPLSIGGGNSHCLFEMTGGIYKCPRLVLVGRWVTGPGSAVFRMKGGFFELLPMHGVNGGECYFNVADSDASVGRMELLGGEVRAGALRGWTGSSAKGGNGKAILYADGGKVSPNEFASDLIYNFDEAVLGVKGLTLDTNGRNIPITQAFADEKDKAGLFVKTGIGTLTPNVASSHSKTLVAGGELYFKVPTFGKNLEVAAGASVSTVGDATSIAVDSLKLGSEDGVATIKIDQGDTITVTGDNGFDPVNALVVCEGVTADGEYDLFNITGKYDEEAFAGKMKNIRFFFSDKDKDISFKAKKNNDGSFTVSLSIQNISTSATTWNGSTSSWTESGNWSSGNVPAKNTVATFPAGASVKTIAVDTEDVRAFEVCVTGGDYVFEGDKNLTLDKISVEAGSLAVKTPQTPNLGMEIEVAADGVLEFFDSVASVSHMDKIKKFGNGLFSLTESSPLWTASWEFMGGKTVVNAANALGNEGESSYVKVGAGTVVFEALESGNSQTVNKILEIDSTASHPAVVDVKEPVTFKKGMNVLSGGLVKKGEKPLVIEFPAGTYTASSTSFGVQANGAINQTIVFDESGVVPEADKQFGGLSVVEGTLALRGQGRSATTVNQQHTTLIGGKGALEHPAVLEVAAMYYNMKGSAGIHNFVGGTVSADSKATNSVLRAIDGAYVFSDTIQLARSGHESGVSTPARHVVAVTNAHVYCDWVLNVGLYGDTSVGALEVGEGGIVEVNKSYIDLCGGIGGTVSGGGMIRCRGASGTHEHGLHVNGGAKGELSFVDGGTLEVLAITSFHANEKDSSPFVLNFDGGIFQVYGTGRLSFFNDCSKRTIEVGNGGMTVNVSGSSTHSIAIPVNGTGGIVKTGSGDLFIAKAVEGGTSHTNAVEGVLTANCTGTSKVSEGTLAIEAGAAREDLKVEVASGATLRVAGDQTLGAISGAGKIVSSALRSAPGEHPFVAESGASVSSLSCTILCNAEEDAVGDKVPLFENVNLAGVAVDFSSLDEDTELGDKRFAVARLGDGCVATIASWDGVNCPQMTVPTFTVENGVVYASLAREGFIILLK